MTLLPRPLADEERNQRAKHVAAVTRLSIAALALGLLVALAFQHWADATGVALAMPFAFLAQRLATPRSVQGAAVLLLGTFLSLATWLLVQGDGLQDITLLLYPVLVLMASLLLDRRPFVALVVAAVASLALVAYGQSIGVVRLIDETLRPEIWPNLLLAAVILGVAAAIAHFLVQDLRKSEQLARRGGRALLESEERYRLISEVASDYTFSSSVDPDGSVRQVWVAGAFEKITGYSFEEYLTSGGWPASLHPDDVERDAGGLAELQANREAIIELRTFTRSGELRWVRVYAHPIWDHAADRLAGMYGAVQNITARKLAEAERESLIKELEAKNTELERFTYTVSHDLKSPLVTIQGFLGFLERDAADGNHERLRDDVERIRGATRKMQRLLDELLELSRAGRIITVCGPVAVGELARDAVALVGGSLAERGVRVEIEDDMPVVWGDKARLLQVVQNLVDNAAKFMGDQPQPRIEIGATRDGEQPTFSVRDNGIGIERHYQERVFGLFDKLDASTGGTGVGLALVQRILNVHGGRIWVESEGRGHGSTFSFTLPQPPPASEQ